MFYLLFINDLNIVFRFSTFSVFTEDLKMYIVINSLNNCEKWQIEFVRFSNWCVEVCLKMFADKCTYLHNTMIFYTYIHNRY